MGADIAEGLRALRSDPVLRAVGLSAAARDFAYGVIGSVILVYATRQLGFRPGVLGLIFAVGGVSSLVGATLARRVVERIGRGRAMLAGLAASGLSTLFLPLAPNAAAAGVACLVAQQLLGDAGATVYEVTSSTTRQTRMPPHLLGRVDASIRFVGLAAMLAGTAVGGLVGEAVGLRSALLIGSAGHLVGVAVLLCSPVTTEG